jgi:hypothetical protein
LPVALAAGDRIPDHGRDIDTTPETTCAIHRPP